MNKRLDVARWAIQVISPQVRTHGSHHPATAVEPSHWVWDKGSIHLVLTEQVLPHPDGTSLENLVDIWAGAGGLKVLSLSWSPSKPWIPPLVSTFKGGDWLLELSYEPQEVQKLRS